MACLVTSASITPPHGPEGRDWSTRSRRAKRMRRDEGGGALRSVSGLAVRYCFPVAFVGGQRDESDVRLRRACDWGSGPGRRLGRGTSASWLKPQGVAAKSAGSAHGSLSEEPTSRLSGTADPVCHLGDLRPPRRTRSGQGRRLFGSRRARCQGDQLSCPPSRRGYVVVFGDLRSEHQLDLSGKQYPCGRESRHGSIVRGFAALEVRPRPWSLAPWLELVVGRTAARVAE